LIAVVIGVVTSILLTDILDNVMCGLSLYVQVEYSYMTAFIFAGAIFAILILTLLSPMKRLKKMNIVNEIKYE
jgi:ABC-type antimicrobial peptide transport system permease subunit